MNVLPAPRSSRFPRCQAALRDDRTSAAAERIVERGFWLSPDLALEPTPITRLEEHRARR